MSAVCVWLSSISNNKDFDTLVSNCLKRCWTELLAPQCKWPSVMTLFDDGYVGFSLASLTKCYAMKGFSFWTETELNRIRYAVVLIIMQNLTISFKTQ
jgi:hypothetical protein